MSDASPVSVPVSLVQATQTSQPTPVAATSGNGLPPSTGGGAQAAVPSTSSAASANAQTQSANPVTPKPTVTNQASAPALVDQLNKYLNDTGRANQFRVDPTSSNQTIQEINPSNGEVIGQFPVAEFPALALSLGVSGVLVDSHA